jgi:hypothetical protein
MRLVWLIETLTGTVSPRRQPPRRRSTAAVMVLSANNNVLPCGLLFLDVLATDGASDSRKLRLPVLLLMALSPLPSLGVGLRGDTCWSPEFLRLGGSDPSVDGTGSSCDAFFFSRGSLTLEPFPLVRRGIGSRVTTRDGGGLIGAMSMGSMKRTLKSQCVTGDIVVGRVSVDVIMYEIVPLSNCYPERNVRHNLC